MPLRAARQEGPTVKIIRWKILRDASRVARQRDGNHRQTSIDGGIYCEAYGVARQVASIDTREALTSIFSGMIDLISLTLMRVRVLRLFLILKVKSMLCAQHRRQN